MAESETEKNDGGLVCQRSYDGRTRIDSIHTNSPELIRPSW